MLKYIGGGKESIDEFVEAIKGSLSETDTIDLSIMPNDGTHYELRLIWQNQRDKYLVIQNLVHAWEVVVPRYISPCFMKKAIVDINPWTAALVCDLACRVCDSHHQSFYNWDEATPQYVLDEVVLDEVDCVADKGLKL